MRIQSRIKRVRENLRYKLIAASFFIVIAILIIGIIDIKNYDNQLHYWISRTLDQKNILYFDIPFVQTTLSLFEITGLFLAVLASFIILREEQKGAKKRTQLAYQPFIKPSEVIRFETYSREVHISLKNIGLGPALFIRVSFVEFNPDIPQNATLRSDQPHSQYISPNDQSSELIFDSRLFYNFITGTKRGGDLGSDVSNYNKRSLRKELNDLIKAKLDHNFFIYIHSSDILKNPVIFKVKYLLCIQLDRGDDEALYLLKRMEIEQTSGLTSL